MTIAVPTKHLDSHLPPVLHVARQSTLILIGESPLKERKKFNQPNKSPLRKHVTCHCVHTSSATPCKQPCTGPPSPQSKLRTSHALSARLFANLSQKVLEQLPLAERQAHTEEPALPLLLDEMMSKHWIRPKLSSTAFPWLLVDKPSTPWLQIASSAWGSF